jgi:diguanylate cyclase (GGDEF)-like protein
MVTAVPIAIQGKKLVVELIKNATKSMYLANGESGYEIKILSTFEHVNQAIIRDELTGVYNRRYINERLPVDLLDSSVKNEPLSVIFADLDFFKAVNDTYGHSAGDYVLREVANEFRKNIRLEKDWVSRYGGEEFLICLTNTNNETAKAIAERIRETISKRVFAYGDKQIHLTCSFGVHTICDEKECLTIDGIIEIADKKLYQAKREGRNRVV